MQAEGVGAYFLDSLYSDIDSLIISAGMHSVHFGKYHRLLSKRFPFAVYYRVEEQTVLVPLLKALRMPRVNLLIADDVRSLSGLSPTNS